MSRKRTFALLFDKKDSVQQTKQGKIFRLLVVCWMPDRVVSCRKFDDNNLMVWRHLLYRGWEVESERNFSDKRVIFLRFCADVFYRRSLMH